MNPAPTTTTVCLMLAVAVFAPAAAALDAVSIYPRGAAAVAGSKKADLDQGSNHVDWPLAAGARPATLWLVGKGVHLTGFSVPRQDKHAANPLAARIGKTVTLRRGHALDDRGAGAGSQQAMLIGVAGGDAFVRVDGRIVRLSPQSPWQLSWPAREQQTQRHVARLDVQATQAGPRLLRASYQIAGLDWQASTAGRFNAETGELAFHSMALIENKREAALDADKAWLVASAVTRAAGNPRPVAMAATARRDSAAGAPQPVGHGYRYALAGGLELAAGATRAATLVKHTTVAAERRFIVAHRFHQPSRGRERDHAEVRLSFDNTADAPLPAGAFRVYDAKRAATLLGAARIGNTPAGAPVTLTLGRAFDVTSTRRIVADTRTDNGSNQRRVVVAIQNAGRHPARVDLIEHLPERARITSASAPRANDSTASRARWQLTVPAGERKTIRYSATWPSD